MAKRETDQKLNRLSSEDPKSQQTQEPSSDKPNPNVTVVLHFWRFR